MQLDICCDMLLLQKVSHLQQFLLHKLATQCISEVLNLCMTCSIGFTVRGLNQIRSLRSVPDMFFPSARKIASAVFYGNGYCLQGSVLHKIDKSHFFCMGPVKHVSTIICISK